MAKSVAICIPSYNCGKYIRDTIESALSQTDAPDEIIISDDHSTDDSLSIIEEYRNNRLITIIKPESRLTIGEHYRFLLKHANSDYITFLSADDVLFPNFISTIRHTVSRDNDITLVTAACIETDGALIVLRARGTGRRKTLYPYPSSFAYMATGNLYTVSFSAMDRNRLLAAPILPTHADLATDWYWALWLTAAGSLAFVKKPLGFYRIHQSNAGHNNNKWHAALPPMVDFLIPHLNEQEREIMISRLKTLIIPSNQSNFNRGSLLGGIKEVVKRAQALPYQRFSSFFR